MKVNFFIVGAPKAGTTSLYHYLDEHPEIEMSSHKEPNFFSDLPIQEQGMYYSKNRIDTIEKYHGLFSKEDKGVIFGEASVSYLFYNEVAEKIKEYNLDAKIIIMLRNPIDRAFSHYLMDYRLGLIKESFESIINKTSKNVNAHLFYQQYIKVSEYSNQIERYLKEFSKNNLLFIDYEEFKKDTSGIVSRVYSFLDLHSEHIPNVYKKYNAFTMPKNNLIRLIYSFVFIRKILNWILPEKLITGIRSLLFKHDQQPELCKRTRTQLKQYFKADVLKLNQMIDQDFSKWIK